MKPILSLLALILAACAPSTENAPRAIPAPIQSAAVTPAVDAVKADASKSREISGRLESQIETLRKNSIDLQHGFSAATSEAAKLKAQKQASEKELDALWDMLNGTEARAKEMFAEVEKAKAYADEQREFRALAEKRLDELAKAAIARDTETMELRAQREHLSDELARGERINAELRAKLASAEKKAAVGSFLKGVCWFIGIIFTLIALFCVATKIRLIP